MKLDLETRIAGLLVPAFAIRTEDDLGIGDTDGVRQMVDWCARHGFHVLQLLPINETGDDNSPYNAISSVALDPLTIAISPRALPDLGPEQFDAIADKKTLADIRTGPVRYRQVRVLKQKLLWEGFRNFTKQSREKPEARSRRFDEFQKVNRAWLAEYCLYRTLMDENEGRVDWENWQAAHRTPSKARSWISRLPAEKRETIRQREEFFAYVQWIAHEQWTEVRRSAEARAVSLMGDIPFGISRNSADVWAKRELFDLQWSGGAPPEPEFKLDAFTQKWGQNWGVPLYRWEAHRQEKFAWWRQRVGQTSRIFHAFRIDHVLGFYRVFAFPWKPEENGRFVNLTREQAAKKTGGLLPRFWPGPDDTEEQKKANCAQGDELLRIILDAAGQTTVIAEDLGVVPEYVGPNLKKLGIPGFVIPHWERNQEFAYRAAATYPRLSIVTPATHDHEPLAGQWRDLWKEHEDAKAKQDHHRAYVSWLELQRFVWWCGWDGNYIPREFTGDLHQAYVRRLMQSNSWLAILMITDVFAQTSRFNVPGPMSESNWAERVEKPVSQLDADPALVAKAQMVEREIRENGRDASRS